MSISMSSASVPVCTTMLGNLSHFLGKAQAFIDQKKCEPTALTQFRLAPDMLPFTRQVLIACDAVKNGPEECDDGANSSTYGGASKTTCAPGCKIAPYCGDGKVDGANGEACDEGATNGTGYGHCGATCKLGPRCGDGVIDIRDLGIVERRGAGESR